MVQVSLIYTLFTAAVVSASPPRYNAADTMPEAPQSTKTMAIVPSMGNPQSTALVQNPNEQCTRKQVTVVNRVTVTLPPPPEMSDETSFSYVTLSPTETNAVINTDTVSNDNTSGVDGGTTRTTNIGNNQTTDANSQDTVAATTTTAPAPSATNDLGGGNPTEAVPVSRAGGTLNPSAAAEANEFDKTAVRAIESVNIRAADGRCLSIDPTAGDFRQNLIPVQMATCSEDAAQKFDIVTQGKHNDAKAGEALLVSVLMNGCLSFDARRQPGDTVTMFSCGGRADGGKLSYVLLYAYNSSCINGKS